MIQIRLKVRHTLEQFKLSLQLDLYRSIAVIGPNGSGKSTLLRTHGRGAEFGKRNPTHSIPTNCGGYLQPTVRGMSRKQMFCSRTGTPIETHNSRFITCPRAQKKILTRRLFKRS